MHGDMSADAWSQTLTGSFALAKRLLGVHERGCMET